MKYPIYIPLLVALLCSNLFAGTIVTRDGKTYSGPLQLHEREVTIGLESGPRIFPFADIAKADFKSGAAAALKAGHGLRGDYFVGRNLASLLLNRVDPCIDY